MNTFAEQLQKIPQKKKEGKTFQQDQPLRSRETLLDVLSTPEISERSEEIRVQNILQYLRQKSSS